MKKIKVITILGTRPEVIKLAPVVQELKKHSNRIQSKVVLTGQHREMVDQFLKIFELKPDYDLEIMTPNQTLLDVTERCVARLSKVLQKECPDLILVEGDTTTAFIAALCAFYLKIPVGHVEAGLRTYDKLRPFPEEVNRQLISVVADLHFAPTSFARDNLLREKIKKPDIFLTGNTVIDALYAVAKKPYKHIVPELENIDFKNRKVILVTAHRRESFGKPFENICRAIRKISEFEDVEIVYPVHLNPNVQDPVRRMLGGRNNIHLLAPVDYATFVFLLKNCYLVLSDSGGVQEETPAFKKPLLVMREVTERQEGVKVGVAKLVGMDSDRIIRAAKQLLSSPQAYASMQKAKNPYGDGKAAQRIVQAILKRIKK